MIRKIGIFSFLFLFCLTWVEVQAQNDIRTTTALAKQAKNDGELEKAISHYESLYEQTHSESSYNELLELYLEVENFDQAEKLTKKRSRELSKRPELIVDRGIVAEEQKDLKEAEKFYEKAIDKSEGDQRLSRTLANRFLKYSKFEWAEKTYLLARKEHKNEQVFRFELANVYAHQGKTEEMIEEYLNILEQNESYIQTIQNIFQRVLFPDPEGRQMEKLKTQLLKRIQKKSKSDIFNKLLTWLYIQDRDFYSALLQAKALDQRLGEQGKRVYSMGKLSLSNADYESAEDAFQYVIKLGDKSPYYLQSKMKLAEVLKEKVVNQRSYRREDLMKLKSHYEKTIRELGKSSYTLPLIRGLANLNAYYIDSVQAGVKLLEQAIQLPNISKQTAAEIKIDLADLMLFKDEIWEASLLYSQVEKEFKYDKLGEIAKFKNAKIAFYTGDFFWAQAQLDVLKGSTSKLIANDALQLSLLITDNVGLDSIVEPLERYAKADLLLLKKDYENALRTLDSIPKFFPSTALKDEILFKKYEIALEKQQYELAATHLNNLLSNYAEDILGDDALYNLAILYEEQLNDREKAMELYKQLLANYPASLFVDDSRKRFRNLRGDFFPEEKDAIN